MSRLKSLAALRLLKQRQVDKFYSSLSAYSLKPGSEQVVSTISYFDLLHFTRRLNFIANPLVGFYVTMRILFMFLLVIRADGRTDGWMDKQQVI